MIIATNAVDLPNNLYPHKVSLPSLFIVWATVRNVNRSMRSRKNSMKEIKGYIATDLLNGAGFMLGKFPSQLIVR